MKEKDLSEFHKRSGSAFTRGSTDEEKVTRFISGGAVSIVATIIGGLFGGALWLIAMNRLLGPKDFGILGPIFNSFFMFCTIISLGIPQTITTYVSHHYETDISEAKKFIKEGIKFIFLIGFVFIVISTCLVILFYSLGKINLLWTSLLITVALGITINLFFWGINSVLNGFQRLDYVSLGNMIFPIGMFISSLGLVIILQKTQGKESIWDVVGASAGMGIGAMVAFICALILIQKTLVISIKELFSWRKSYGLFRKIISFGGLSALALVGFSVLNLSPPQLVLLCAKFHWYGETLKENLIQSGYFSTAMMYASAPLMIMGLVFALIPAISEAEGKGRLDLMQKYFNLTLKFTFVCIIGIIAILYSVLAGEIVFLLSGAEFPASTMGPITTVVSIGMAFIALNFLLINLYIGIKRPYIAALIVIICIFLEISIIIILSYLFKSILAAAAGLIIATAVGTFLMFRYLVKNVGLTIPIWALIPSLLAGLGTMIIIYFLPKKEIMVILDIIIAIIIYFLLYAFFGGWAAEDFKMFKDTLIALNLKSLIPILNKLESILTKSPFFEWYKLKGERID